MTYLGVVLDNKLNWNKHIQTKVSKCKQFLAMLRPAIKHHWGLSPKKVQWIWKQMILPRLTYGCHVWGHSLMKNSDLINQESLQRLCSCLLCSHVEIHTKCWFRNYSESKAPTHQNSGCSD